MPSRVVRACLLACALLGVSTSLHAQLAAMEPEWYLPTPDGCRIFVREAGIGFDTVVVLHGGWGADHSYLLGAFAGLESRFHFVFYDQRGSLRSPCAESLLSVSKLVEDLEQLRSALRMSRMTIAAHSMGTFLAMEYLTAHPDRVRGMVLFGAVVPRTPTTARDTAESLAASRAARAFISRPEVAATLHAARLDGDTARLTPKQRTAVWRIRFAGVNLFHMGRWSTVPGGKIFFSGTAANALAATAPSTYDFTPALLGHPCPVTVIQGDHDYLDTGARHAEWTRGAAHARLVVLPNAGHASWIDAPVAFRTAMADGLRRASSCGPGNT